MVQNQCSPMIKTFLIVMFACCMIAHHWTWDELCDVDTGSSGGAELDLDSLSDVTDLDKGHSYTMNVPAPKGASRCGYDNNTDNRAYLAFYILTLVVALIGFCCVVGQTCEAVYGGFLITLWFWWIVMEGLRIAEMHSNFQDLLDLVSSSDREDYFHDLYRTYMSFHVGQFLLYSILFIGTATDCFECCSCQCVRTVVVSRKAVIEV